MLRITGFRKLVGTVLISNALVVFQKTIKALEQGIQHLQADKMKYRQAAAENSLAADECDREIIKAAKTLDKIKQLVEA